MDDAILAIYYILAPCDHTNLSEMGQKRVLIETESKTSISQMYGYNAVSSLYTKYYPT